jgi:hypothetical protein
MSAAEIPVDKGRTLLVNRAMSLGYSEPLSCQLADAALWLERIEARGVHSLLVYLILTKDLPFEQRKPSVGSRYGMRCVCPIMAADLLVNKYSKQSGLPKGIIGLEGPAAPALMAPALVEFARTRKRAVRLHAYDTKMVFGENGFRFEDDSFGHFPLVDPGGTEHVGVEFIDPVAFPEPQPLNAIQLSKVRVHGFGDTPAPV